MSLLDLVEQNHRIRASSHRLGQLAALFIADVSRRRANQPRDGVTLLIFRHVDANHRPFVIEQELRQRSRQLRLTDAGRSQEDEAPQWTVRVLQSCSSAPDRVTHRADGLFLANDALVDPLFHVDELLDLTFYQSLDRDTGPLADHLGDIVGVDLLFQEFARRLRLAEASLLFLELLLLLDQLAILKFRRSPIIGGALRLLDLQLASVRSALSAR